MDLSHSKISPWLWVGLCVALILVGVGGWLFLQRVNPVARTQEQLAAINVGFPLFYLKTVPDGMDIPNEQVKAHEGVVIFGISAGENHITITQQARPKFMEEVNKVQDIAVPVGTAYIAKLHERTVGFLLTETTLVIVSAAQAVDASTITAILGNLVVL